MSKATSQKFIGAHVSTQGGVELAPLRAAEIGARAFALFTGSSNRWKSKAITPKVAAAFKANCESGGFAPAQILAHDNFLVNLGTPDPEKRKLSLQSFVDEFQRCEALGLTMLNFHPGSSVGLVSDEEAMTLIAQGINQALAESSQVVAVLENVAGQGTNIGYTFEQLASIMEQVSDPQRVGVCIDTCHAYSAGYDLRSEEGYERTWRDFDRIIGFDKLYGMHLNDDKRELGSRIDRHASIGEGTLGRDFFRRLMADPRFDGIPLILETPDETRWAEEIAWLYDPD